MGMCIYVAVNGTGEEDHDHVAEEADDGFANLPAIRHAN